MHTIANNMQNYHIFMENQIKRANETIINVFLTKNA